MSDNKTEILHPVTEQKPKQPYFFWGNIGVLISGVATGVLAATLILVSYKLLTANKTLAQGFSALTDRFVETRNAMADAQKAATDVLQAAQQTNDALKSQAQAIADLQKNQQTNKNDYLAAEALYLVHLASDSLQYEKNPQVAIKLLQSADQSIAKLTDSKAYTIREALSADVVALQGVQQIDVAGIFVRLSALSNQLEKLPWTMQFTNNSAKPMESMNHQTLSWWQRGLNAMEQVLQRVVIVRKNAPNLLPFIAPDQQMYLMQNLHSELEKAQWGLLHQQQDIYRVSLQQAANWIKQYAVQDAQFTKQVLADLTELQKVEVQPTLPTVDHSLQALQGYVNK